MKLKITLLAWAAMAACVTAQADVITNGGFETGDFSGWSMAGNVDLGSMEAVCANGSDFGSTTCTSSGGAYAAAVGPYGSAVALYQDVATTADKAYSLTFDLRSENLGQTPDNTFDVYFGGTKIYSLANAATFGYTGFTIQNLVATSDNTQVGFVVQNDPGGFFLDDVALTPTPEPASLLLVAVPLSALGLMRRKRVSHSICLARPGVR